VSGSLGRPARNCSSSDRLQRQSPSKIRHYAADPDSLANNVETLQARAGHRLRVGNCRVLFTIDGDVMTVTAIRTRSKAYD